jgi:hypothetical protein
MLVCGLTDRGPNNISTAFEASAASSALPITQTMMLSGRRHTIKNQRLSRVCIVHLVIKRTNWSYVKTMSCSGSHLGITINIKNTKFAKDFPMIDAQFRFNQCNSFIKLELPPFFVCAIALQYIKLELPPFFILHDCIAIY